MTAFGSGTDCGEISSARMIDEGKLLVDNSPLLTAPPNSEFVPSIKI